MDDNIRKIPTSEDLTMDDWLLIISTPYCNKHKINMVQFHDHENDDCFWYCPLCGTEGEL